LNTGKILFNPEDIAWAAHCAIECGVDVVKVPYCGDVKAYAEIVATVRCPWWRPADRCGDLKARSSR
jgi:class I fructose-bisphosphate aldolase